MNKVGDISLPGSDDAINKTVRISTCYDFQWSRGLWRDASNRIAGTAALCLFLYSGVESYLAYLDGVRGVDIPYYISACVTTVGLGDIAPESQLHRAATVVMLPFGLVIISLCLSAAEARSKAVESHLDSDFNDIEKSVRNEISLKKIKHWYTKKEKRAVETRKKLVKLVLQYALTLAVGCSFFLLFARERRLQEQRSDEAMTVIDAIYFASLTATSVGYGHRIVPQTIAAKGFLSFFFFSTLVVGAIERKFVGAIFKSNEEVVEDEIIRETIWIHRTALLTNKTDKVTEADFLIFKLMQLQRVDEDILHRLQKRFDDLDTNLLGNLEVGVQIPSAEQVAALKEEAEKSGMVASEEWLHAEWRSTRKNLIEDCNTLQATAIRKRQRKKRRNAPKREADSGASSFPGALSDVLLVPVSTDCCHTDECGHVVIDMSHPGFAPLCPALAAFFRAPKNKMICGPALSPRAALTLDKAALKKAGVPLEAQTFAFAFPMGIYRSLIDSSADLTTGACRVVLNGAFFYFDKHDKVVAINCFVDAPPLEGRSNRAPVLQFDKPLDLPEVAKEALSHRLRPVTNPSHRDVGAVAFTWINRGEAIPGIIPYCDGAFAYIFKGGRSVYFPLRNHQTGGRRRVSQIHDFAFSRSLWFNVFRETVHRGLIFFALYVLVGYYAICKSEGWDAPTSWYFLSTTFTTVGYGDYAPTKQLTRAIAIGLLPLGFITVGLAISAAQAYKMSRPHHSRREIAEDPYIDIFEVFDLKKKESALEKLFLEQAALFDINDNGQVTRAEVVQMAPVLDITAEQAGDLFDKFDVDNKGSIPVKGDSNGEFSTIPRRLLLLCFKVYWPVLIAASFFKVPALSEKIFSPGHIGESMTWIDSLYFATVTVTTVGFGDITPQTSIGKWLIAIYVIVTCVWVGSVLRQFIDLYVNEFIGEEIIAKVIGSTTNVHKCDVIGDGKVSVPEYLLFKLQELQMVDKNIVDILRARFNELDRNSNLALDVGVDVPSAEQVINLRGEVAWWNPKDRTLVDAWEAMQTKILTNIEDKRKYAELKKELIGDSSNSADDSVSTMGRLTDISDPIWRSKPKNRTGAGGGGALGRARFEETASSKHSTPSEHVRNANTLGPAQYNAINKVIPEERSDTNLLIASQPGSRRISPSCRPPHRREGDSTKNAGSYEQGLSPLYPPPPSAGNVHSQRPLGPPLGVPLSLTASPSQDIKGEGALKRSPDEKVASTHPPRLAGTPPLAPPPSSVRPAPRTSDGYKRPSEASHMRSRELGEGGAKLYQAKGLNARLV